jgi:hypothetical protein
MSTPGIDSNDVHELSLDELDAVAGGNILAELARAGLGWLVGKVAENGPVLGSLVSRFNEMGRNL